MRKRREMVKQARESVGKFPRALDSIPMADMLSPAEAARIIGVTPCRVRQMSDRGELAVVMTPLGRLYARADIEHIAKNRQRKRSEHSEKVGQNLNREEESRTQLRAAGG